jgi:hypothetical protein
MTFLKIFCRIWNRFHFLGFHKNNSLTGTIVAFACNSQPGGPDPCIYVALWQGDSIIPQGTGVPSRSLLRLTELRWSFSNPPPHGDNHQIERVKLQSLWWYEMAERCKGIFMAVSGHLTKKNSETSQTADRVIWSRSVGLWSRHFGVLLCGVGALTYRRTLLIAIGAVHWVFLVVSLHLWLYDAEAQFVL